MIRYIPIVLVLLLTVVNSNAHESRPAYLQLTEAAVGTYEMVWKVPAKARFTKAELDLELPAGTTPIYPPKSRFVEGAVVEQGLLHIPGGLDGKQIRIGGLVDPSAEALVRVEHMDGRVTVQRLTPQNPSLMIEAEPSATGISSLYTILGMEHIWAGLDHLLFVLCLIMLAQGGKKLIAAVTGFTLAHSITLALSVLDLVKLPMPPVEAVIALSIVFLATELARGNTQSLTYRYPILVSSLFGLLHGLGFASALIEIGLPHADVPLALLFFNVGVETGQILFIIAVLASVALGRRLVPWFTKESVSYNLQRAVVYLVGITASFWLIERTAAFF